MSIFNVLSLFGGLAMFLYGMRLMGDALKTSASGTVKRAIEKVTNNPVKAFLLGAAMTAIIQSSTATIVITSGLVAAGILSLHQSLGIIVGANVGTTVTGQIIRLLDVNASGGAEWLRLFQPSTLAPVALIIGIVLIMSGKKDRNKSVGSIAIGFGILFSGLMNMTGAVDSLAESGIVESLFRGLGDNPLIGYITGVGVSFVLQSSSAAVGILQAFSASGLLTFKAIYAVIVGIYLGDCVTTAIVCSIGAKEEQRRVGIVNILFNLSKSALVLVGVTVAHQMGLLDWLWDKTVNSGIIANSNTIFNIASAVLLFPLLNVYEKASKKIVQDKEVPKAKYQDKIDSLNPAFFISPAIALSSSYDVLLTIFRASRASVEKAFSLIENYDDKVYDEILAEEENIDQLTNHVSKYNVELLSYLHEKDHIEILNQYYKVTAEFERLGDHGENIAKRIDRRGDYFTSYAKAELKVAEELIREILQNAELAFAKRDEAAARQIEPLVQVMDEIISLMRSNHLKRMSSGVCDVNADASFENLLVDIQRVAAVCSNIGIATVVRIHPELADHEHMYYSELHSGKDEVYNQQLEEAHSFYYYKLKELGEAWAENLQSSTNPSIKQPEKN